MVREIEHDRVTRTDDLGNRAGTVPDQLLCVAQPHVGTVRKTRYLQKIRKILRFCFLEHSLSKRCAEFGQTPCAELAAHDILRLQSERFACQEQIVNRAVRRIHLRGGNAGIAFQNLQFCRHIMSELVELQNGFMQIGELKVRGDDIGIRCVRRMLDRREIVHLVFARNNDDAAGMLSGCALDSDHAVDQTVNFRLVQPEVMLLRVFGDIAVRRF